MAEKVVSFIVPAYNSEAYLEKCLKSFLHEGILDDIEVLVINDGSTDKTDEIGETYAKKYPGTFKIVNKVNGGHGSVINLGTKLATGKYLKVIDSDDWVITENLPAYIDALRTLEADVVLTNYHMIDMSTGNKTGWTMFLPCYGIATELEILMEEWKSVDRCFTFHGITYRREFYLNKGHDLLEGVYYEDHEYATIPCCFAKSILPLDLYLYEYQVGNSTQSVATINQLKHLDDLEKVIRTMKKFYLANMDRMTSAGRLYFIRKLETVFHSYFKMACLAEKPKTLGYQKSRKIYRELIQNQSELCKQLRVKYCLFMLMNRLHVDISLFNQLLSLPIYNSIRKNHDFEK